MSSIIQGTARGGGNTGFMTARGAGDLLTRITWILFSVFLLISLTLAFCARCGHWGQGSKQQTEQIECVPHNILFRMEKFGVNGGCPPP